MTPAEIRIECLKLAHRHDHTADEVVARAKALEQFVAGPVVAPDPFEELQSTRQQGGRQAGNRKAG